MEYGFRILVSYLISGIEERAAICLVTTVNARLEELLQASDKRILSSSELYKVRHIMLSIE